MGFWTLYIAILVTARLLLSLVFADVAIIWTVLHTLHALLTFVLLHWVQGRPFTSKYSSSQGELDRRTFWEQLDGGIQFTPTRKFFFAVATVLSGITLIAVLSAPASIWAVNALATVLALLPKMPFMHK